MVISDQWDRMETMGTGRSGGMFTQGRRNRLWIVELGGVKQRNEGTDRPGVLVRFSRITSVVSPGRL